MLAVPIHGSIAPVTPALSGIPDRFALYQNFPNPFASSTLIRFDVPRRGRVRLAVYDLTGKLVRTLQDADMPPGRLSAVWDGRSTRGTSVASGIYFCVAEMGHQRIARKTIRLP